MLKADLEVIGVMGRCNLQGACSERDIDILILYNGYRPIHERQNDRFESNIRKTFIIYQFGKAG